MIAPMSGPRFRAELPHPHQCGQACALKSALSL